MKKLALLILACLLALNIAAQNYSDLFRNTPKGGPISSGKLPELTAYNHKGEQLKLQDICADKYTLLVMGCITCPEFRKLHPQIECISEDYSSKGVQFFYVYKNLRHPELDGYVEAQNISERMLMVDNIKKILGGKVSWLIDDMNDNISQTLLSGSRSVYLISPKGEISTAWAKPEENSIRETLAQLVGTPKKTTTPDKLNLPESSRVQRRPNIDSENTIERGDGLIIVKTTPKNPEDTYYVKLRVEADEQLLSTGSGRLALGFFPDPIHDAHWNNLAEPMEYVITAPKGIKLSPAKAKAKKGQGDSDEQPRQFWVDIKGASPKDKLEITYHYYGCTSDMCEALTHSYTIELTPQAKGSSTFGFNKGQRANQNRKAGRGNRQ